MRREQLSMFERKKNTIGKSLANTDSRPMEVISRRVGLSADSGEHKITEELWFSSVFYLSFSVRRSWLDPFLRITRYNLFSAIQVLPYGFLALPGRNKVQERSKRTWKATCTTLSWALTWKWWSRRCGSPRTLSPRLHTLVSHFNSRLKAFCFLLIVEHSTAHRRHVNPYSYNSKLFFQQRDVKKKKKVLNLQPHKTLKK